MITHDVIIVGAGSAGMRAAIESSKLVDTALVTKVHPVRSHTGGAQGGINAAINAKDKWDDHWFDTVKGGDYLVDQDAAEIFAREAPERIYELERWGVIFSRTSEGDIAQRPFGGQNFPRCCYAADRTGHVILQTQYEQVVKNKVKVYEEFYVTKVLVENGHCVGVVAFELATGSFHAMRAKAVIFATGGNGRMYSVTSNSHGNTSDGVAMCYREGIPIEDMEFVQFHPTGLYGHGILLTEGARGEGAYIRNDSGERFMARYAKEKMELGPRDVVSRAIWTEILEGRGIGGQQFVHLDLVHLGKAKIMERLPQVHSLVRDYLGLDTTKDQVPIQPTAHYFMGGIPTDVEGKGVVPGLFAAGECACVSIHGANRLGGNSLLETVLMGRRAGLAGAQYALKAKLMDFPMERFEAEVKRIRALQDRNEGENIGQVRHELQVNMTANFGVFRNQKDMDVGMAKLKELKQRATKVVVQDKGTTFNTDLVAAMELRNLIDVAEIIGAGALLRTESRGAHFRRDFAKRDDAQWLKHTMAYWTPDGPKFDFKPVTITKFPPQERKY